MKSYTDIEQSKVLSKILPSKSADMYYLYWKEDNHLASPDPIVADGTEEREEGFYTYLNCWSLSALLDLIPKEQHPKLVMNAHYKWICDIIHPSSFVYKPTAGDNPLDAVFEMIIKLHELKML